MKIGFMELLVVFIVALLLIGPDKLPHFAQKLGAALRKFREASSDVSKEVRENVIEPLEEAQKPIQEVIAPLEEVSEGVKRDFQEVEKSFRNIGKPAPRPASVATAKDDTATGLNEAKSGSAEAAGSVEPVEIISEPEKDSPEAQAPDGGSEDLEAGSAQPAEAVTPVKDNDSV